MPSFSLPDGVVIAAPTAATAARGSIDRGPFGAGEALTHQDQHGVFARSGTVRAIIADRDGVDFLIANAGDRALYVCATAQDGDVTTGKLAARITTERERLARRQVYAQALAFAPETVSPRQEQLWNS